jgi:hypothetical protein
MRHLFSLDDCSAGLFRNSVNHTLLDRKKAPTAVGAFCILDQPRQLVAVLFVPVFLLWKNFERVLWGWAWQRPFQCVRIFVPWVRFSCLSTAKQRVGNDPEEEDEGCKA